MSQPTPSMDELAAAFTTHLSTLEKGVHCGACGGTDLQLNRLALLPDMPLDQAAASECTPVALLMCRTCLHLMPFAWLPIMESVAKGEKPGGIRSAVSRMLAAAQRAVSGA